MSGTGVGFDRRSHSSLRGIRAGVTGKVPIPAYGFSTNPWYMPM